MVTKFCSRVFGLMCGRGGEGGGGQCWTLSTRQEPREEWLRVAVKDQSGGRVSVSGGGQGGEARRGSSGWGAPRLRPPPPPRLPRPPQPRRATFLQQHASRDVQWWCPRLSGPRGGQGGREGGRCGLRQPVFTPWLNHSRLLVSTDT